MCVPCFQNLGPFQCTICKTIIGFEVSSSGSFLTLGNVRAIFVQSIGNMSATPCRQSAGYATGQSPHARHQIGHCVPRLPDPQSDSLATSLRAACLESMAQSRPEFHAVQVLEAAACLPCSHCQICRARAKAKPQARVRQQGRLRWPSDGST